MDNSVKIKTYPKYFKYLPISDTGFTTFIFKTIYLNKDIYEDIKTSNPKPLSVAVLKHQETHVKNAGICKFLSYVLSKEFRIKEEQDAFKAMFKHLKQNGGTFDLEKVAKNFASARYLWMTTYKDGLELITKIWREA